MFFVLRARMLKLYFINFYKHVSKCTVINNTFDLSDPFVKVYLLQNGKKVNKKKTTVKRGEQNPIFNEAMIFSVPASALPVSCDVFPIGFALCANIILIS